MSLLQSPINTGTLFEPLLTIREAAPFLRLHYKTLESMARAGVVPATKHGKSWVFRLSRLSDWINREIDSKSRGAHSQQGRLDAGGGCNFVRAPAKGRAFSPNTAYSACNKKGPKTRLVSTTK
jgi:excisionase family DNA binding protein